VREAPGLAKEVSLPAPSPELKPPPKTLPPKGFGAPPTCPNGDEPLERLLPPNRDGVSELEAAGALNGEAEPDALANELRGLAPDWRKGEDEDAKPARPELLKADVEVALLSAESAVGVSDLSPVVAFGPVDDGAASAGFWAEVSKGHRKGWAT
jgi:hypothetical protein